MIWMSDLDHILWIVVGSANQAFDHVIVPNYQGWTCSTWRALQSFHNYPHYTHEVNCLLMKIWIMVLQILRYNHAVPSPVESVAEHAPRVNIGKAYLFSRWYGTWTFGSIDSRYTTSPPSSHVLAPPGPPPQPPNTIKYWFKSLDPIVSRSTINFEGVDELVAVISLNNRMIIWNLFIVELFIKMGSLAKRENKNKLWGRELNWMISLYSPM